MLLKTQGIVLRFVKYKETSVIATIYTRHKGLVSVIANSVRSKKGKIALFQPLSMVELVIYYNEQKQISRISEISSYHPLHQLRQNPVKACIGIFITELLNKCLKEEEAHEALYDFIQNSIVHLNEQAQFLSHFHLLFLVKLSLFLGIKPSTSADFLHHLPDTQAYQQEEAKQALEQLLVAGYDTTLRISPTLRHQMLNDLLHYYRVHLDIGSFNSVEVLHELLR